MSLTDQTYLQLITRLAHELNDCVAVTATSRFVSVTVHDGTLAELVWHIDHWELRIKRRLE